MKRPDAWRPGSREAFVDHLADDARPWDLVVVGGGITGAGVLRDAASRGLRALLVDKRDFASGTSSRSSKLIHGGLRYLAMGDVGLVRTTALERKEIFRLAPHLAERRWMVVPVRSWTGLLKIRAGVGTYEKLGAVEEEDRHRSWDREEMAREEPLLDRERFKYAVAYREYLTDDARLVLANLRDAAGHGAVVLNHAPVVAVTSEDGRASGVEAECRETGRRVRVRARCVVNAAGPWVEAVRRLESPDAPPLLHLSKGVHFVLRAQRVPVRNMLALTAEDRRTIFVIRRGTVVYVGTTDTTYEAGNDVWPAITRGDVDYLLAPLNRDLAVDPVRPREIVAAWAGLRPLIAEPGKEPKEISRRDEVLVGPAGVVTIAGGKLTGYRPMAKEVLEKAAEVAGLSPRAAAEREAPLPGGDFDGDLDALDARFARELGLPSETAARLARLYGSEAPEVVACGSAPLVEGGRIVRGEIDWALDVEGAATLEDVLYRRMRTALYSPHSRELVVEPVADAMAERLGWSAERRAEEVRRVRAQLEADLDFTAAPGVP